METPVEFVDAQLTKLIQQVPAMVILFASWYLFLKHMTNRDKVFLEALGNISREIHESMEALRTLRASIETRNSDVCNFHHDFQQSLNRIESAVSKTGD